MLTSQDLENIRNVLVPELKSKLLPEIWSLLEPQFNKINLRLDGLDSRVGGLDSRVGRLESRVGRVEIQISTFRAEFYAFREENEHEHHNFQALINEAFGRLSEGEKLGEGEKKVVQFIKPS